MKTKLSFLALALSPVPILAQTVPADSVPEPEITLDDFVVVAKKPVVQTDGAKLTYNMEEDPSSKGNTLLDALKKVPMVSVDGEDNIRINGENNFKIYLNGKEDPSLSSNYKNIFKAMPAEAVVKVEVITEPGAKYDAEGTAGIINIITVSKKSSDGIAGTATAAFSKQQSGISLYGSMRKNRLALSANVDYSDGGIFPASQFGTTTINNSSTGNTQVNEQIQKNAFRYIGGGLHLSYDLSDSDLLTADANVYSVKGWIKGDSRFSSSIFNSDGNLISFLDRRASGNVANTGVTAGAAWQHQFDQSGQKMIVSYLFNYGYDNLDANFLMSASEGLDSTSPFERIRTRGWNHEHTAQIDYIRPFSGDNHTLEAGAKGIWRRNDALSGNFFGNSEADARESESDKSDLTQIQDIYAAYASYSGVFGNWKASAGVRYEHTRMGIDFHYGDYDNFINRLNDVVPNASVTYMFSHTSNLRLSYQMRISRPSLSQVNPYRLSYTLNDVEFGNPSLSSERANKIGVTYSNFAGAVGGNVSLEYQAIENAISSYYYSKDGVNYRTYGNIGSRRNLSLRGYLSWSITPKMQFSLNARLNRKWLSSDSPHYSNKGWSLNYGANWNYSLPLGIKVNAYGGQQTRQYHLQGYDDGWFYYGLGISKGFLKNEALTVTVNANNFLQKYSTWKRVTTTEDMTQSFHNKSESWNVGISLSWNFGSMKGKVKKTAVSISNDDTSSESTKNGNGL